MKKSDLKMKFQITDVVNVRSFVAYFKYEPLHHYTQVKYFFTIPRLILNLFFRVEAAEAISGLL